MSRATDRTPEDQQHHAAAIAAELEAKIAAELEAKIARKLAAAPQAPEQPEQPPRYQQCDWCGAIQTGPRAGERLAHLQEDYQLVRCDACQTAAVARVQQILNSDDDL